MDKPGIFLAKGKEVLGPFTPEQIEEMKTTGAYADCSWIWESQATGWVAINRPPEPIFASDDGEDETLANLSGDEGTDVSTKTGITLTGMTFTGITQTGATKTVYASAPKVQPDFTLTDFTSSQKIELDDGKASQVTPPARPAELELKLDDESVAVEVEKPASHATPPSTPPPGAPSKQPPKLPGNRPSWIDRGQRDDFKYASIRVAFDHQGGTATGALSACSPAGCTLRCRVARFSPIEFPKGRRLQLTLHDNASGKSETVYAFVEQVRAESEYADFDLTWRKMPSLLMEMEEKSD